jgi:tetratricopeptide (TPR) repeat protein
VLSDENLLARDRLAELQAAIDAVERLAADRGDRRLEAFALARRGLKLHATFLHDRSKGEPPDELPLFEQALAIRREIRDQQGIAESLFQIGLVHQVVRDDSAAARPFFEESYERAVALGDDVVASHALRHVAFCDEADGDEETAEKRHLETLELRRRAGWVPGQGAQLFALATLRASQGRVDEARDYARQARAIFSEVGAERLIDILTEELGDLGD